MPTLIRSRAPGATDLGAVRTIGAAAQRSEWIYLGPVVVLDRGCVGGVPRPVFVAASWHAWHRQRPSEGRAGGSIASTRTPEPRRR